MGEIKSAGFKVVGEEKFLKENYFVRFEKVEPEKDNKDEAIKKDRKFIEGTWRVVAYIIDGNKEQQDAAGQFTVVNGSDGTWSLRAGGNEICKGTSTIDPTKKPKTIDFTRTDDEGKGKQYLGIYEYGENSRKLCATPGKERPTDFSSKPGSKHDLVTFERVKAK